MKFAYIAALVLPALALAAPSPAPNRGGRFRKGQNQNNRNQNNKAPAKVSSSVAAKSTGNVAVAQNNNAAGSAVTDSNSGDFDPNSPPNPQTDFDPATSGGDLGPFVPVRQPSPQAKGGKSVFSAGDVQRALNAVSSWSTDTTIVSNFLNIGSSTARGAAFNTAAHVGYAAEVDELTHKGILDSIIGNDPQVSVANLTLTNGVFQSVVNNLQIMSVQGKDSQELIDEINKVRCTQVLPSIDTYMLVVNRMVSGSILKASGKPDACRDILAQQANNVAAFPNVPNVPGGTDLLSTADAQKGVLADSQAKSNTNQAKKTTSSVNTNQAKKATPTPAKKATPTPAKKATPTPAKSTKKN